MLWSKYFVTFIFAKFRTGWWPRNEGWWGMRKGLYYQGFMLSQGEGCGEDVRGNGSIRYGKSPTSKIYTTWARLDPDFRFSLGQTNIRRKLPLHHLGDRNIFHCAPWGEGEERRGLMPLGLFFFAIKISQTPSLPLCPLLLLQSWIKTLKWLSLSILKKSVNLFKEHFIPFSWWLLVCWHEVGQLWTPLLS